MKAEKIGDALLNGKEKIGIWGVGYIGLTNAIYFAESGVKSVCFDINRAVVDEINQGIVRIPNLESWMNLQLQPFVVRSLIQATTDFNELRGCPIHFIAVPTEREEKPWLDAIKDVLKKIKSFGDDKLIAIESTLTPGAVDKLTEELGLRNPIAVAPRRDWFQSPEMNLRSLPRVFGVNKPEYEPEFRGVLSIVCNKLLTASSHKVAEMVKSVENSLLHVPVAYALEVGRAYPNINISEVFDLASTHWRIPKYSLSFGTGGYCIPLSTQYVVAGAERPHELKIAKGVIESDRNQPKYISKNVKGNKIAILGICYKGDLKVCILSPTLKIAAELGKEHRDNTLRFFDPYYSPQEIKAITGGESLAFPADLASFSTIILGPAHRVFRQLTREEIKTNIKPGTRILDSQGCWETHRPLFKALGIEYMKVGDGCELWNGMSDD